MCALPARCTPVVFADINDGIGEAKVEGTWTSVHTPVIGVPNRELFVNGAGQRMRMLMETQDMVA
eukprot:458283-Pyramimonas_sp.AAC.1